MITRGVLWCCHTWQLFIPGECHLQTALPLSPCACSCPSGCGDPQQEDKPLYPQLLCSGLVQDQRSLCLLWFLPHFLICADFSTFFYSSPHYKCEDGICSPCSMCHNTDLALAIYQQSLNNLFPGIWREQM